MAGDLTTLANVKAWLNIQGSGDDALLSRLISGASNFVQTWTNRVFASQSYTETRSGGCTTRLQFSNYPVTAVSSLTIDGISIPQSTGSTVDGYLFTATQLVLIGYRFSRGDNNIVVTYTAGYSSTPYEVEQAVIELIALRYRERDRTGLASKSMAGETTAYFIGDMPASVKTILTNYKKVISL